jgi:hypothetical protein
VTCVDCLHEFSSGGLLWSQGYRCEYCSALFRFSLQTLEKPGVGEKRDDSTAITVLIKIIREMRKEIAELKLAVMVLDYRVNKMNNREANYGNGKG